MSCEKFVRLVLMASFFISEISLVFPWMNLYEGPLIPCEAISFCMRFGVHHSLWKILMRAKRRNTHRKLEMVITRSPEDFIFSYWFSELYSV